MAGNHQLSLGPMEGKALVRARSNGGSSVEQPLDRGGSRDLFELIVESVGETCSEKEAAISLGLSDETYWSKVKAKERPAPRCNRVTDLPAPTQKAVCKRWARQLGMRVSDDDTRTRVIGELVEAAGKVIAEIA